MVISTITPLMAGEITILTPRMGEENTTPKEDKGDIVVLDPILNEPETPNVVDDEKSKERRLEAGHVIPHGDREYEYVRDSVEKERPFFPKDIREWNY